MSDRVLQAIPAVRVGRDNRVMFELPPSEPWMADGVCAQTDWDVFFPGKGQPSKPAKRVCRVCPVVSECRAYALRNPELRGVWGGLSERERERLVSRSAVRKAFYAARNAEIYSLVAEGRDVYEIANRFGMTTDSVWRVLRESRGSA